MIQNVNFSCYNLFAGSTRCGWQTDMDEFQLVIQLDDVLSASAFSVTPSTPWKLSSSAKTRMLVLGTGFYRNNFASSKLVKKTQKANVLQGVLVFLAHP
jgi:hypothetical protein